MQRIDNILFRLELIIDELSQECRRKNQYETNQSTYKGISSEIRTDRIAVVIDLGFTDNLNRSGLYRINNHRRRYFDNLIDYYFGIFCITVSHSDLEYLCLIHRRNADTFTQLRIGHIQVQIINNLLQNSV